jgi:hypothetical protein
MAEQARIMFAASAIKGLLDLQSYYSGEGAPDAGKKLVAGIMAKIERLGVHPLAAVSCLSFRSNICERSFPRLFASFIGMLKTGCVLFESGEVKDF